MKQPPLRIRTWILVGVALLSANVAAQGKRPIDAAKARVIDLWTPERRAAAIPRDLFIDPRGLGYLRHPGGYLQPYGHDRPATAAAPEPTPSPFAKGGGTAGGSKTGGGGGSGDTTPPTISGMNPGPGQVIGESHTFSATVTDASGVQSVTFRVGRDGSSMQSFSASRGTGASSDTWSATLQGFTAGSWTWEVVAKDATRRGGNTGTSSPVGFSVGASTGSGDCANCEWTGGTVQTAAGRIYFYMGGTGYVCSGTVVADGATGRSVILTAAHCVYDDVAKAFAHDVMFIPNQAGSTARTDRDCSNDPMGCWVPDYGVVDLNWTNEVFPKNVPWDYAFYVVPDTGAHQGTSVSSDVLDAVAGSLPLSFAPPVHDTSNDRTDFTHALGYSYSEDPKFMFCAQDMSTEGTANWWLSRCGLSGGASGGPWVQPMDTGTGTGRIISVNSWGYVDRFNNPLPGMAGPKLSGTSAQCVFAVASSPNGTAAQPGGTVVSCP